MLCAKMDHEGPSHASPCVSISSLAVQYECSFWFYIVGLVLYNVLLRWSSFALFSIRYIHGLPVLLC